MVRAGTLLTFDVAGSSSWMPHTADGIRSEAADLMRPYFDRVNIAMTVPSFTDDPFRTFKPLQYTAVVVAAPRSDYATTEDVSSIVRHAFIDAADATPTVSVRGVDPSIGPPKQETPSSFGMYAAFAVIALVAVAVIVVAK